MSVQDFVKTVAPSPNGSKRHGRERNSAGWISLRRRRSTPKSRHTGVAGSDSRRH
jgi:hypothetical protein